jgi:hypothetical protein
MRIMKTMNSGTLTRCSFYFIILKLFIILRFSHKKARIHIVRILMKRFIVFLSQVRNDLVHLTFKVYKRCCANSYNSNIYHNLSPVRATIKGPNVVTCFTVYVATFGWFLLFLPQEPNRGNLRSYLSLHVILHIHQCKVIYYQKKN